MHFEQELRGTVQLSVPYSQNQIVMSFDTQKFIEEFDRSETRSMSRQSIVLRGLAREMGRTNQISFMPDDRRGTYVLATAGETHANYLQKYFEKPDGDVDERLRSWPAKHFIGQPGSMCAAQIAIETQSYGPIFCLFPSQRAAEELIEELSLDFQAGRIQSALVAFAFSALDPTDKYDKPGPLTEVAFLAYLGEISEEKASQMIGRLKMLVRDTKVFL